MNLNTKDSILNQVITFNNIWMVGLFFFGFHLILLSKIFNGPKWISIFLMLAGAIYIIDTTALFTLSNYQNYADLILAFVAIPSILGEMSMAIWFLVKRGK